MGFTHIKGTGITARNDEKQRSILQRFPTYISSIATFVIVCKSSNMVTDNPLFHRAVAPVDGLIHWL